METGRLEECFLGGPVVDVGGYQYFVNPLSDGVPRVDPDVLREAAAGLLEVSPPGYGLILAPEAMGIPLATALSLMTDRPFAVIRKRRYGLPGEIAVDASTGYSRSSLYIDGVSAGDRILLVDDVIDTGGTAGCIVRALRRAGAEVAGVSVVFDRSRDIGALSESLGVPVRAVLRVGVDGGRPVVLGRFTKNPQRKFRNFISSFCYR